MKQQSITTLPPSPEAERRSRMIKYTIAMSVRVLCIFAMLFARGWWLAVFAAGAVFLPYVAVVLANVSSSRPSEVLRPGAIVPVGYPPTYEEAATEEGGTQEGGTEEAGTAERGTGAPTAERSASFGASATEASSTEPSSAGDQSTDSVPPHDDERGAA